MGSPRIIGLVAVDHATGDADRRHGPVVAGLTACHEHDVASRRPRRRFAPPTDALLAGRARRQTMLARTSVVGGVYHGDRRRRQGQLGDAERVGAKHLRRDLLVEDVELPDGETQSVSSCTTGGVRRHPPNSRFCKWLQAVLPAAHSLSGARPCWTKCSVPPGLSTRRRSRRDVWDRAHCAGRDGASKGHRETAATCATADGSSGTLSPDPKPITTTSRPSSPWHTRHIDHAVAAGPYFSVNPVTQEQERPADPRTDSVPLRTDRDRPYAKGGHRIAEPRDIHGSWRNLRLFRT